MNRPNGKLALPPGVEAPVTPPTGTVGLSTNCGCGQPLPSQVDVAELLGPGGAAVMLQCSNCGAVWAVGAYVETKSILVHKPRAAAEEEGADVRGP